MRQQWLSITPNEKPIANTFANDTNKELNAEDKALKIISKTKNIITNIADQNIINATKSSPPYSIVAEDILRAALCISSSDI